MSLSLQKAEIERRFFQEDGTQLDIAPLKNVVTKKFEVSLNDISGNTLEVAEFDDPGPAFNFIDSLANRNPKATEAFHKNRRMFVIEPTLGIRFADPETLYGHPEWFERLGWNPKPALESLTRGFVSDQGIFAYTGVDFKTTPQVETDIRENLGTLIQTLSLKKEVPVFCGMVPQNSPGHWPGLNQIGTTKTL